MGQQLAERATKMSLVAEARLQISEWQVLVEEQADRRLWPVANGIRPQAAALAEVLKKLFAALPDNWNAVPGEQQCAWELHVELRTRITTQRLHYLDGDEATALDSLVSVFRTVREVCRKAGPGAAVSLGIADVMLNQLLRPLTARWHQRKLEGKLNPEDLRREFRADLAGLLPGLELICGVFYVLATGKRYEYVVEKKIAGLPQNQCVLPAAGTTAAALNYDRVLGLNPEDSAAIAAKENEEILARRRVVSQSAASRETQLPGDSPSACADELTGLAISGGGIRSATFSLGVIQALARHGILAQVDLLSTVSGGGYTGCFLSSYLNTADTNVGPRHDQAPFRASVAADSSAIRYIRNRSRYIQPRGFVAWILTVAQAAYGIVSNLLILLAWVFLAVVVTDYFMGTHLREMQCAIAEGQDVCLPKWPELRWVTYGSFGVVAGMLLLLPTAQRTVRGLGGRLSRVACFEVFLLMALGFSLLLFTGLNLPQMHWGYAVVMNWIGEALHIGSKPGEGWSLTATFVTVSNGLGLLAARVSGIQRLTGSSPLISKGLFLLLWAMGPFLLGYTYFELCRVFVGAPGSVFVWPWLQLEVNSILLMTLLAALCFLYSLQCNVNFFSLHRYYRNRLCSTFLLRPPSERHGDPPATAAEVASAEGTTVWEDLKLSALRVPGSAAPYHLINAAVNLPTSDRPELRGRNCDFFLMSKHFSGGPVVGYRKTSEYEQLDSHFDLGAAMAISGAAAAPQMGVGTIRGLSFLMTLLNVRLGYWLQVSRRPLPFFLQETFTGPGPLYLLREAMNRMNERNACLNLSDGGHIENLAVIELLRRRCRYVIAIDGEHDPNLEFHSLRVLQRYALIDLGVDVEIDCSRLQWTTIPVPPGSPEHMARNSRAHFAVGRIIYPDDGTGHRAVGFLIYLKLSVTGNEPDAVSHFRLTNPAFPHDPTLTDQVFDEDQFEAYRRLGEHAGADLFADELLEEWQHSGGKSAVDLQAASRSGTLSMKDWVSSLRAAFRLDGD
jgi:hypothetical protein